MSDPDPAGSLAAKFSIPYALAARLVLGDAGPEAFRGAALGNAAVRTLARRVEVIEDPELTARVPAARPARVEVSLAGGRTLAGEVDVPSGEFDRPYPVEALFEKFLALARLVLGARGARAAWALLETLPELADARALAEVLRSLEAGR